MCQVSLKMQYCGHLYSSLLRKQTWVDHRDQFPIYKEEWKMILFPSAIHCISSYLSWLYFALQALLPTQTFYKVTDRPALLLFMLHNSMAFTGEFKDLHFCTYICGGHLEPCGKPCYDKNNLPRAQMGYTPIAPVLQILYKNKKMAEAMQYWHVHLQEGLQKLEPGSSPVKYSDFSDSINHIDHYQHLQLFQDETDTAITISGDSARLTMKKQSDVWVLVVTILNLPPNMWSKAANIIIPLVIPGPCSPGNVESFVYVLYEELAKLSLGVWTKDELTGKYFLLKVYLCGVLGDMLGSAKLSKMTGHMATYGCHFCTVWGAHPSEKQGMTKCYIILSFYLMALLNRC